MHPDDLKTIWRCCECRRNFLFHSDVEYHKSEFNHSTVILYNIPEKSRKSPTMFIRGRTSLGFRLNDKTSRIIIEYQYYPASGAIVYVDVQYTDKRLQSKVEGNAEIMKNIDNYLRKLLSEHPSCIKKDSSLL
jgi:hypothetical protein